MFYAKINPEIIDYLRVRIGPVAQLNRASDSGSAGLGFESQRGHKKAIAAATAFLYPVGMRHLPFYRRLSVLFQPLVGETEMVVPEEAAVG